MAKMQIGDAVAFSRAFLQSTGQFTGPGPFARGRVIAIETLSPSLALAKILWNEGHVSRVNVKNLVLVSRLHLEPV